MLLHFTVQNESVFVQVTKNRELLLAGKLTNYSPMPLYDLMAGQKPPSKEEEMKIEVVEKITKHLPNLEDVKNYLKIEMGQMGMTYEGELEDDAITKLRNRPS